MWWNNSTRRLTHASLSILIVTLVCLIWQLTSAANLGHPSQSRLPTRIEYRIIKTFAPEGANRFTIIIIVVDPPRFTREQMETLADQLSIDFSTIGKLKVGLLDDERPARQLLSGALEPDAYEKLQRGVYYLDRIKCVEYIRFTIPKNRSVTINRKCRRK